MSNFQNLKTTKIGDIAEDYIYGWLLTGGTVKMNYVYSNYAIKSHPFDFICYSADSTNTKYLGDVKVKYPRYDGTMSIHAKDLDKYLFWSEKEGAKFILFYVNHKTGEIMATTPESILQHGVKTWDAEEYKWLYYFKKWKQIDILPEDIRIKMNNISNQITNKK